MVSSIFTTVVVISALRAHELDLLFYCCINYNFRVNIFTEVDYIKAVVFKQYLNNVFPYVVNIALDGGYNYLILFLAAVRFGRYACLDFVKCALACSAL